MLSSLKSLNIVRLDDVAGKVRFAVTTTELNGFGKTVIRTFEQVTEETITPSPVLDLDKLTGSYPTGACPSHNLEIKRSEPAQSAPDGEHLSYAEHRLHQLETLGVDALSPQDPMFALCGNDKAAAVEESIKIVRNHIAFYTNEIARKLAAPKVKRGRKPKAAAESPPPVTEPPPAETHPDSAAADAAHEAEVAAKILSAKEQQAELAKKLQDAQQQGFKW